MLVRGVTSAWVTEVSLSDGKLPEQLIMPAVKESFPALGAEMKIIEVSGLNSPSQLSPYENGVNPILQFTHAVLNTTYHNH